MAFLHEMRGVTSIFVRGTQFAAFRPQVAGSEEHLLFGGEGQLQSASVLKGVPERIFPFLGHFAVKVDQTLLAFEVESGNVAGITSLPETLVFPDTPLSKPKQKISCEESLLQAYRDQVWGEHNWMKALGLTTEQSGNFGYRGSVEGTSIGFMGKEVLMTEPCGNVLLLVKLPKE